MNGKIPGVRFCEVLSIDDDTDAHRIKVRLLPEDDSKDLDDIDYAFPLLPKHFFIKPKVGESVLVLLAITNDGNSQRYYIGPVISQEHKIYGDSYFNGADSVLRGGSKELDVPPRMKPEAKGALPNDEDVSIRGRKNADIQITPDDVRIKAGVKVMNGINNDEIVFNGKRSSFVKTKYHLSPINDNVTSTATIVGDKICLLGNTSRYPFTNGNTDDLMERLEEITNLIESED
jgi:hypothetical protein